MEDLVATKRYVALLIGGAALLAAACSEPLAPNPAQRAPAALVAQPSTVAAARGDRGHNQEGYYTFWMSPRGGEAQLGPYVLRYDARSVCDPATSGYGLEFWAEECRTLRAPVVLVAHVWYEDGRAYVEMNRDLRFDPTKSVVLSTNVPDLRNQVLTDELRAQYSIGYTTMVNGQRVFMDDASWDPSLATVFGIGRNGRANGNISRRVLHFSGYYVRSGRLDEGENTDAQGDTQY